MQTVCSQSVLNYPKFSEDGAVEEKIFDTTIVDKYRIFENFKDNQEVIEFYTSQNELTEKFYKENSLLKKYERYLYDIDKNENDVLEQVKVAANGAIIYLKMAKRDYERKIYYRSNIDAQEEILFNPENYNRKSRKEFFVSSYQPSWDGKKIAIGVTYYGGFASDIVVLDLESRSIENTGITNSRPNEYGGFQWLPDNSGFTYTALRHTDTSNPNIKINTSLSLYSLETKKSTEILGNGKGPNINERLFPMGQISSKNDKYLIGYAAGPSSYWDSYYINFDDLKNGQLNWKTLFKEEDKVYKRTAELHGNNLYFITGKLNDLHTLSKINLETKDIEVLVPSLKNEVIKDFEFTKRGIYLSSQKYGTIGKVYKFTEGVLVELELPVMASKIGLTTINQDGNNLWIDINNPITPVKRFSYHLDDNTFKEEHLYTPAKISQFKDVDYKLVEVLAHDDDTIPMTIIYKKGLEFNGNNQVLSLSYGAFGTIINTNFKTHLLSYVSLGGVLVFPHIRGGGAKGKKWHEGGKKTTKHNSWKDLISCIDYLIINKYTNSDKITLYGRSAGTIPIAMAVNERPNLAKVMILESGVLNPSRKSSVYGSTSFVEYGTIDNPSEAKALIAMDPYLNIRSNVEYPSTMVVQGLKDDRVYLFEGLKYITKLQQSNIGTNPILLDLDFKGTHNDVSDFYNHYARIFAFSLRQTDTSVKLD